MRGVTAAALILLAWALRPEDPAGNAEAGKVRLAKFTSPEFDRYTNNPAPAQQRWLREHFARMIVHTPYFDRRSSWYGQGLVYFDLYAIYNSTAADSVAAEHPEWILRDAAGRRLYIPWGCDTSKHTCPQFAGDISNPEFRAWWVNRARQKLRSGNYAGLWLDDVNLDFQVGDGDGKFAAPRDPATRAPMTEDNWRRYMAEFVEKIRRDLPEAEIVHNTIWYAGGGQGSRNPYVRREIAAADGITVEHGFNDGGLRGGTGTFSLAALMDFIDSLNAAGKKVYIGNAGGDHPTEASMEYAVACYLLVNNGNDFLADSANVTPDRWWPVLDSDVGAALGPRHRVGSSWRRDFAGGSVVVNEPGAGSTARRGTVVRK
jgi:hypothetical protein